MSLGEAWSEIWGGDLESIGVSDPARAPIEAWWRAELEALAPFGRLLEVGAGSAALPAKIAKQRFPAAEVVASDFREPQGRTDADLRYAADAPIERLPFATGHFDLVVSQFAFEYADPSKAISELGRVLRPGGSARLMMHDASSVFARTLERRLACLRACKAVADAVSVPGRDRSLRRIKLRQALRGVVAMLEPGAGMVGYADAREDLLDALRIGRAQFDNPNGALSDSDSLFQAQCGPALQLAEAQKAASLSDAAMGRLAAGFRAGGFSDVQHERLFLGATPIAWVVRLTKA